MKMKQGNKGDRLFFLNPYQYYILNDKGDWFYYWKKGGGECEELEIYEFKNDEYRRTEYFFVLPDNWQIFENLWGDFDGSGVSWLTKVVENNEIIAHTRGIGREWSDQDQDWVPVFSTKLEKVEILDEDTMRVGGETYPRYFNKMYGELRQRKLEIVRDLFKQGKLKRFRGDKRARPGVKGPGSGASWPLTKYIINNSIICLKN